MAKAFGIVTSTPRRVKVAGLQDYRSAGAISMFGRYRVIDFPISNLTNSGIDNIQVYIGGKYPRSLVDHLGTGRQYNINSKKGRLQLLYCEEDTRNAVYNTDVANYLANKDYLDRMDAEYVVITPCYMIFKEDYSVLLQQHIDSGADVTMLYHKVNNARDHFLNCRVLTVDENQKVTSLAINHANKQVQNIFMDTYVMKSELFLELVQKTADYSSTFSMSQMLESGLGETDLDIRGVQHKGYFAAIADLDAYYEANMELLDQKITKNLFTADWPFYTTTTDACPTKLLAESSVKRSVIADGCEVAGDVENCVIGRGVKIGKGAFVKNSIILSYCEIGPDVHVENEIVDVWTKIRRTKELVSPAGKVGFVRKSDLL